MVRIVHDEEGTVVSEFAPAVRADDRPNTPQVLRECLVAAEIGKFVPDDWCTTPWVSVTSSLGVDHCHSAAVPVLRAHKEGIARHCRGPTSTLFYETISVVVFPGTF